jgi:hypothetical protein
MLPLERVHHHHEGHCQDAERRYRIHLIHTFTVAFAATSGHDRLFGLYDYED